MLNGLRELGEPARKALITTGFAPEIRARAVGIYWGLRSFAFFPAPIVAALLWWKHRARRDVPHRRRHRPGRHGAVFVAAEIVSAGSPHPPAHRSWRW